MIQENKTFYINHTNKKIGCSIIVGVASYGLYMNEIIKETETSCYVFLFSTN